MTHDGHKDSVLDLLRAVWSRRKHLAMFTFAAALAAAASLALSLPDVYRSTATVLVEREQVPEALVRPSVSGELEARLQTLNQEILSRARLADLISRLGLYPDMKGRVSPEALVERMRRDIRLELKSVDPSGGRGTIAFALTYQGTDPRTVAAVANTLASFYIEENMKAREKQATGAAEFLKMQLDEMQKRLEEQEKRVGDFKASHNGELSEQVQANLATLERLNAQLQLNNEKQSRALDRRDSLAMMGGTDATEPGGDFDTGAARLERLQRELVGLRARYSDKYPDVIRLRTEIAALKRQMAEPEADGEAAGGPRDATRSRAARANEAGVDARPTIPALKQEEGALRKAIAEYQRRVENAPLRDQEARGLARDYATTKDLYDSLAKRYEEAQMAENMEQRQKGEQFRVLDSAVVPAHPAAPNRLFLLLLGLALSFTVAAGAVSVAERLDASFHTLDDLRAFTRVPVLVSIPLIPTTSGTRRRRLRFAFGFLLAVVGMALLAGASHYAVRGNERLTWMLAGGRS